MKNDKKRVLVVDDDSESRRIFKTRLTSMGLETILANNGEEAMEMLAEDSYFDLIITDVMMPYLTGFDFSIKTERV